MHNEHRQNKGGGCLRLVTLFFWAIFALLFVSTLLVLVLPAFALYGFSFGVIGIVLPLISSEYPRWLTNQRGFKFRLSKLPGLQTDSPTVLAIATALYIFPLSFLSWSLIRYSFSSVDSIIVLGIFGLIGTILMYGWFISGWRTSQVDDKKHNSALDKERELYRQIERLDQVKQLDPIAFENFVGTLFTKMGYEVSTTATTSDEGVDLLLRKDDNLAVVQCKRYEGSVGQPVVRDLYGAMVHNRATEAYLVTSGTITLPAQQWAKGKSIHLVDGKTLIKWIESFEESPEQSQNNTSTANSDKVGFQQVLASLGGNRIAIAIITVALFLPICSGSTGLIAFQLSPPVTPTPTIEQTIIPTETSTPTLESSPIPITPTLQSTAPKRRETPLPTETSLPNPTETAVATNTPLPTATSLPNPTETAVATNTPISTATLLPNPTETAVATNTPVATSIPTEAPPPIVQPTAQPVASCVIDAWVNDETPAQRQHVSVYGTLHCDGQPIANAPMSVTWNYKSTTANCSGVTDNSGTAVCDRSIGGAAVDYYVRLNVSINHNGQTYSTTTGFTPR